MRSSENWGQFVTASISCNMLRGQNFVSTTKLFSKNGHQCHTNKTVGATCSLVCATVNHIWRITTSPNNTVDQSELETKTGNPRKARKTVCFWLVEKNTTLMVSWNYFVFTLPTIKNHSNTKICLLGGPGAVKLYERGKVETAEENRQ